MTFTPINVFFVETDRKPFLSCVFEGVDISVYTTIVLKVRRQNGTLISINAILDDAPNGAFHFAWGAGDLAVGHHTAEIVFTDAGGLADTLPKEAPINLIVRPHA